MEAKKTKETSKLIILVGISICLIVFLIALYFMCLPKEDTTQQAVHSLAENIDASNNTTDNLNQNQDSDSDSFLSTIFPILIGIGVFWFWWKQILD